MLDVVVHARAVIFDLDGTLLDTIDDLATATNAALAALSLPLHASSAYREMVGEGVERLIRRAVPQEQAADEALIVRCKELMLDAYDAGWAVKTRPYPGVERCLSQLHERGIPLAVLSNKLERFTRRMVEHFFGPSLFELVCGQRDDRPRKPDPTVALEISEHLKLRPGEIAFIGDTAVDMLTARRAGMIPIGVLWGFRGADELSQAQARHLVHGAEELTSLLVGPH